MQASGDSRGTEMLSGWSLQKAALPLLNLIIRGHLAYESTQVSALSALILG